MIAARCPWYDEMADVPAKPHEMEQVLAFNRGSIETEARE